MGLETVGIVASVAGTAVSALGAIQQGKAQAAMARYQAQVAANNQIIAAQNAEYATKAGEAAAYDQALQERARMGALVAGLAAQGTDVNTGSAADLRLARSETGQTNVERVRQDAALRAYGYRTQETSFGAESQLQRAAAKNDISAGYAKAGGTLLSGLSSVAGKWGAFTNSATGDWSPRSDAAL